MEEYAMPVQVNEELTQKIAKLSRLKLSAEEISKYTRDLSKILDFVSELNEVDTTNIEPTIHGIQLDQHMREDIPVQLSEVETARYLQCAEQSLYEQFKVPQVIGGE